jgi:hypothetical protein
VWLIPLGGSGEWGSTVSALRTSLSQLVDVLADAVAPDTVGISDGGAAPVDPVVVRVVSVARVGRSRRDGPVLDLELAASVNCTGTRSIENVEQLLGALEHAPQYIVTPVERAATEDALGFLVRVPVAVRIPEPEAPLVREPAVITALVGRELAGVLIGKDERGISGARIRSHASGQQAESDANGRFRLLSTPDPVQEFTVEYRGSARRVTANADPLPLTIRWD